MIIGFSNGVNIDHQLHKTYLQRYSPKSIENISPPGTNAIEIHTVSDKFITFLCNRNYGDHMHFQYISLHLPATCKYKSNDKLTKKYLNHARILHRKLDLHAITIHYESVADWKVFQNYEDLPIAIENADINKSCGQQINEFQDVVDHSNLKIVFDLQHSFSTDPSLKKAELFYRKFKKDILQFHISGCGPNALHVPLYKQNQDNILEFLKSRNNNIPIIIESDFQDMANLIKEWNYIREYLTD